VLRIFTNGVIGYCCALLHSIAPRGAAAACRVLYCTALMLGAQVWIARIGLVMAIHLSSSPRGHQTNGPSSTQGDGALVLERHSQKAPPPPMYRVIMLNDDFTPMEFVVNLLQKLFHKDIESATRIMMTIHLHGKGICGVYTRDVATTKIEQVLNAAQQAGHPLQCLGEPV